MKGFLVLLFFLATLMFFSRAFYLLWLRSAPPNAKSALVKNKPMLFIKSAGITLPIFPSEIKNFKMQTTEKGVSYLLGSGKIGQKGNSVLYAHNWNSLFAKLSRVKPGDQIIIITKEGKKFVYAAEYSQVVTPDQVYVLNTTTDARLTLFTCAGFLDSKRLVVTASLTDNL